MKQIPMLQAVAGGSWPAAPPPVPASPLRTAHPGCAPQTGHGRWRPTRSSNPEDAMMNDSASVRRRPRRAWQTSAEKAAAIIAMAGLALLAAACGGSPSSTGSGSPSNARSTNDFPSGRLLPLHAFQRGDQLPRPRQQRSDPQGELAATRGHQLQASSRPRALASTCSRTEATGPARPRCSKWRRWG